MFYTYPIEATANNWLHDCLGSILQQIHTCLRVGQALPAWPGIVPEAYRARVTKRNGLRDRITRYHLAMSLLTREERDRILQAFADQNDIAHLLACACECEDIEQFPESTHHSILDLFAFAFQLLTELGIRDEAYRVIHAAMPHRLCAFCGLEDFAAPGGPREDLDHYLSEGKYPFAAANLHNLVPMGHKCNSKHKLANDILRRADGNRRRSFDPYGTVATIQVSLSESQPFEGKDGMIPAWRIDLVPISEEVETWNEVFRIRERFERDILNEEFTTWLRNFASWCKSPKINLDGQQSLLDALNNYADYHDACGLSDRSFLKAAVFRMLLRHCQNGNERLIMFLSDLVE